MAEKEIVCFKHCNSEMVYVEGDGKKIKDFYIGKYSVTQKFYKKLMLWNPSWYRGNNKPVNNITYLQAAKFCNKLSKKMRLHPYYRITGKKIRYLKESEGFRLLDAKEWRYAAKGGKLGKGYEYPGSDDPEDVVWFDQKRPRDVGTLLPNELGLYDMCGNIYEYLHDQLTVGCFFDEAEWCKVDGELQDLESKSSYKSKYIGFRIGRTAK